jgi:phosphatidylserine decarboxylase
MKIPLTKYGWPEVVVYPAAILAGFIIVGAASISLVPIWAGIALEMILGGLFVLSLMFFRDPERAGPKGSSVLLAPADGKVTVIEKVEENGFIGGPALKIGIFLSIFNVHINRAPCKVRVERVTYKKGRYINAANPESGRINESNELDLVRTDSPKDRLVVRQISGAIARRIVCSAGQGQLLAAGERFGMIKFGSRTELYVPASKNIRPLVQVGDKVKAGLTPLLRYELCED